MPALNILDAIPEKTSLTKETLELLHYVRLVFLRKRWRMEKDVAQPIAETAYLSAQSRGGHSLSVESTSVVTAQHCVKLRAEPT